MSDNRPPYHRRPTRPLPRAELAPPASSPSVAPAAPDRPEEVDIDEHVRALREAPTLVSCPWCHGEAMVTHEKRQEWLAAYPELTAKEPLE
jgi:hypothetical protein